MKTNIRFLSYLAQFILEWKMFQTKDVGKIKTRILCLITFSWKSCRLWDNVEKYSRPRQATDGSVIQRMHFTCWITKATDTHSEYVIPIAFPRQQWLYERVSMLRYTSTACLVLFSDRQCTMTRPPLHFCAYPSGSCWYRRRISVRNWLV